MLSIEKERIQFASQNETPPIRSSTEAQNHQY